MGLQTTPKPSAAPPTPTGDQPRVQPELPASLNRDRVLDSGQAAMAANLAAEFERVAAEIEARACK